MRISQARFEELVFDIAEDVINRLPDDLRAEAAMVMLDVAAEPPEADLLGLYEGVPLVERGPDEVVLQPDRITLFYRPLVEMCRTDEALRREIRITLIHELGHFFGFDEDELEARGWA